MSSMLSEYIKIPDALVFEEHILSLRKAEKSFIEFFNFDLAWYEGFDRFDDFMVRMNNVQFVKVVLHAGILREKDLSRLISVLDQSPVLSGPWEINQCFTVKVHDQVHHPFSVGHPVHDSEVLSKSMLSKSPMAGQPCEYLDQLSVAWGTFEMMLLHFNML